MKQTVYITTTEKDTWYKIQSPIDADGLSMSANAIKHEGFFFTEEQLKQLLSDYTDKIVENVLLRESNYKGSWTSEGSISLDDYTNITVDKESITNQLDLFIKTIK